MAKICPICFSWYKDDKLDYCGVCGYNFYDLIKDLTTLFNKIITSISLNKDLFNKKDVIETMKSGRKYNYYKFEIRWKERK